MTAPNLLGTTTVTGKTAVATLSSTTSNIITNSSSSNTVDKLNSIVLTNSTGANVTCNVMINRSSTAYPVGGNINIPMYSSLVLLGKDTSLYLEEGDVLQANTSASSGVNIFASYELMS